MRDNTLIGAERQSASPRGAQLNASSAFPVWTEVGGASGTDQTSVWLENRYLRAGELQLSARTSESAFVTVNPEQGSPVYASPKAVPGSNPGRWSTTEVYPQRADSFPSGLKPYPNKRHDLVS